MSAFFTQVIYACLIIHFINATTWPGMIFSGFRRWFSRYPLWVKKPLYDCVICMSPWWAAVCWFLFGNTLSIDLLWFCLITGGLNAIIVTVIGDNEL